jgi:hypothetical protein
MLNCENEVNGAYAHWPEAVLLKQICGQSKCFGVSLLRTFPACADTFDEVLDC